MLNYQTLFITPILKLCIKFCIRGLHKRRPHKIAKNWPLPPHARKMSALDQPPLSVRTHHTFLKNPKFFCMKKCGRPQLKTLLPAKCSHWNPPPFLSANVFYGRSLIRNSPKSLNIQFRTQSINILTMHTVQQQAVLNAY